LYGRYLYNLRIPTRHNGKLSQLLYEGLFALDEYKYELDPDEKYVQLVCDDDIEWEPIEFQYVTPKDTWDIMGLREAQRLFNEREEMKAWGIGPEYEDFGPDANRWYWPYDPENNMKKPGKERRMRRFK